MKTEQRHLSPFQTRSPVERAEQSRIILVAEEGEHAVALDVKQDMSRSLKFVDEICKKIYRLELQSDSYLFTFARLSDTGLRISQFLRNYASFYETLNLTFE